MSKNITLIKNGGGGLDMQASDPQMSSPQQKDLKSASDELTKIKLLSTNNKIVEDQQQNLLKVSAGGGATGKRRVNVTLEFILGGIQGEQSNRRQVRSVYARDYLQQTENESIVISKVYRYMCAICSKIFQKIFSMEEQLVNLMQNPDSFETAGDLLKKIQQDLFKNNPIPLLTATGVPIPQDNCPHCDEPAYLLLNQFTCVSEGASSQNLEGAGTTSFNIEQSPSQHMQLLSRDKLRALTDQTQIIPNQNYQTLEVNLSNEGAPIQQPSSQNLSFLIKNGENAGQLLTINSYNISPQRQMPQHHILKSTVEKLYDCRAQKRKVQVYILSDQKCNLFHSLQRQKKIQSKNSFKFFGGGGGGGGTGGFEGEDINQCEHQHMIPPQAYANERAQCIQTNKIIMRNILDHKMRKNKSYYELRNLNQQPNVAAAVGALAVTPTNQVNYNTNYMNPAAVDFIQRVPAAQERQQQPPNRLYRDIPPIKESSSSIGEEGVQQNQPQVGLIGYREGINHMGKLFPKEEGYKAGKMAFKT